MIKLGNRRKRRPGYLLDVKVQTRGRALARLRITMTILVVLGLFLLTCYGLYRLVKTTADRLVYGNPRFAIQQIVVDNDGVLTPERVVQFAGVQIGQNLLSLDLNQVRGNLEMLPLPYTRARQITQERLKCRIASSEPPCRCSSYRSPRVRASFQKPGNFPGKPPTST